MSEVLIVLNLRRRSGVLAAAVAAVHRAGLEFQSQRMVDADGAIQLLLKSEGEVAAVGPVAEIMGAVSGVEDVADIRVDDVSILHPPIEPEPEPEFEVESIDDFDAGLVEEDPWSEPDEAEEPTLAVPPSTVPDLPAEPEQEPEIESRPEPSSAGVEEQPAKQSQQSNAPAARPEPGEDADMAAVNLTPSMLRRRRRRR